MERPKLFLKVRPGLKVPDGNGGYFPQNKAFFAEKTPYITRLLRAKSLEIAPEEDTKKKTPKPSKPEEG